MLKKAVCACMAALILWAVPIRARGAGTYGEILVWLRDGEEVVRDGTLEIYRAGDPVPEGYLLGEEFGGGIIAGEDIPSPAFALWMSEKAGPSTEAAAPDGNGIVWFDGLEPGMYLIRQGEPSADYAPIRPFLACVSEELSRVDTYPEICRIQSLPKTAQGPEACLGVMGISLTLTGIFWCLQNGKDRKEGQKPENQT